MAGHAVLSTLLDAALEKKPTERYLDKVSKKVGDRWRSLLIYLDVPKAEIDSLFLEHRANLVEACFFGLVSWLQVQPSELTTWSTLLEALERAEQKEFADSIRENIIYITTYPTLIQRTIIGPGACSSTLQEKPSEIDLDIVSKKTGQWRSLLTNLGILAEKIKSLGEEFRRPVDICFFGLIVWLQGNTPCKPVTWAVLCEALKEAGRRDCTCCQREQVQESRECPPILKEKPSVTELNRIKMEVNGDWRSFLTHLGVPATKIRSLYQDFQGSEEVCYAGMVFWRDGNEPCKPATWDVLLGALEEGAERKEFAENKRDELCAIDVACLEALADIINSYIQAVNNLIQQRDKGIAYFREAADDIDRAFKRAAAAKITGSGLGIVGGILGIVGGGLLLGGVTAPAGIPLLAIGSAVGVSGAITGVGATIGDAVENRIAVKRANEWLHACSDLCKDVIEKHRIYHDELERICQCYGKSGEDVIIGLSIERKGLEVDASLFQDADDKTTLIITEWIKAFDVGSEGIATAVASGTRVAGEIVRGAFGQGEVITQVSGQSGTLTQVAGQGGTLTRVAGQGGTLTRVAGQGGTLTRVAGQGGTLTRVAGQGGTLTRVAGQGATVTRGVSVGAETGAAVARVAVQATGGVVIALSAAFIVVDLVLIGKTAYDVNKNKKGTELSKWLREAADDIERETEILRCFAHTI